MSDWQKILHASVDTLGKLEERFGADVIDVEGLAARVRQLPDAHHAQRPRAPSRKSATPMWQQYVPTVAGARHRRRRDRLARRRRRLAGAEHHAPLSGPRALSRQPGLRDVLPLLHAAPQSGRSRRRFRSTSTTRRSSTSGNHPEIRDVILSGGDPMMLSDRRLEYIFQKLREIPHVEIIRLGSRITSHLPSRITPEFCEMVQKYHPIYMNTHFNHPAELTEETVAALGRLANAGIPLGCQTVLLRGVNDDPMIMKELMQKLLKARVRPYYLYMADQVAGGEHFRTTVEKGLEIIKALRGWTSGLAVPHFVIDAPGGGGKVPLLPEYVEEINEDEVIFRNYEGQRFVYKQPRLPAIAAAGAGDAVAAQTDVVSIQAGKKSSPRKKTVARKRKTGT